MTKYEEIREHLSAVRQLLWSLYECGLGTVYDNLTEEAKQLTDRSKIYGMELLAEDLAELVSALEKQRHEFSVSTDGLLEVYERLCEYVTIGIEKTQYDMAEEYYQ